MHSAAERWEDSESERADTDSDTDDEACTPPVLLAPGGLPASPPAARAPPTPAAPPPDSRSPAPPRLRPGSSPHGGALGRAAGGVPKADD